MKTVGHNVVALHGLPITSIPEFCDKRGIAVTFEAAFAGEPHQPIEVTGTRTVFDLVLHRIVLPPGKRPGWCKWVVSEPMTGRSVAWGRTRQGTLDDLALRVAYYGGEGAFQRALDDAILRTAPSIGAASDATRRLLNGHGRRTPGTRS